MTRQLLFLLVCLGLAGCTSNGNFTILGYTTEPNYDTSIRYVYVPIFKNNTFRRGIEFDMTRQVVQEIEAKTPYKVVSNRDHADAEILGRIVTRRKNLILINPLNEIRDQEVALGVEVSFLDLRAGQCGMSLLVPEGKKKEDINKIIDPLNPPKILITPVADFIPELGGSLTSAEWQLARRVAIQIVSQMEIWR